LTAIEVAHDEKRLAFAQALTTKDDS